MSAKQPKNLLPSSLRSLSPGAARLLSAASLLVSFVASGCDDPDAFGDEASTHRDATSVVPPTSGSGTGGYTPTVPETHPEFFCPYRYAPQPVNSTGTPLPIPYCASASLDEKTRYDFKAVTRLVISQHGRGSDGHMYFDRMNDAATALESELDGATFVIAPQFFDMNPIDNKKVNEFELNGLMWWKNSTWPDGLLSNGHPGESFSSYTVLDGLVAKAIKKMPGLQEIIFVGQSAGGQTVQKYAVLSSAKYPAGVSVRYVPANPFLYAYVDAQRSSFAWGQQHPDDHLFETPDANTAFPWETTLVCPELENAARPDDYNDWGRGLEDTPGYSGILDAAQQQLVKERYVTRDVTYLVGEDDMFTDSSQCGGSVQVQGKHRRRRAEAYVAHVQQLGADHQLVKVPDFGHGSGMFSEDCVRRVIFGLASDCDAFEDHDALAALSGEITGVVAFETDDGDDQPELVVAHRLDGVDRLYLLDDLDHGFGLLADITPAWGVGARVTGLKLGNVSPEYPGMELVVGVSGGDGGWYLLGADDGEVVGSSGGGQGQDVAAITTAQLSAEPGSEVIVAWDATQGERWRAFAWDGNTHAPTSGGTYPGSARPVAIEVGNFIHDNTVEIAVALDSTTGARIALGDTLGNINMVDPAWPDGQHIVDAKSSRTLGAKGHAPQELVLATTGGERPWLVLEEDPNALGTLTQVLEAPESWPQGSEPTSIAVGIPMFGKTTVAIGRTGSIDGHAVLYTYERDEVEDEEVPVLGDVRVEALGLGANAEVPAVEFADLDDKGSDEILIGRAGDLDLGYRLRVLSAL